MLAKVKPVDYFHVPEGQASVHERLEEWARWVRVRPIGWQVHPMFKQYRSHAWQWHTPEISTPVNLLQAVEVEKMVASLPDKHRDSLRWCYVLKGNPAGMAHRLAVSKDGLLELVNVGRTMLKNKLRLPIA